MSLYSDRLSTLSIRPARQNQKRIWGAMAPALVLLLCLDGPALGQPAASTGTRLTLDDLLKAESLGEVWFSPDGRRILHSRERSIASTTKRDLDAGPNGQNVFMAVRGAEARAPTALDGTTYAPVRAQDPWAPDSSDALVFVVSEGAYKLGLWNATTGAVKALPGLPRSTFPVFAWSGGGIAYAALSEGEVQQNSRRQLLEGVNARWRASWSGNEPQLTVSSANPAFTPTLRPEGRLMFADRATGEARKIADGDYWTLSTAPDGKRLAALRLAEPAADALFLTGRRLELEIFEMRSDGPVLVHSFPNLDVGYGSLAWSADGSRLLAGAQPKGGKGKAGLYVIDPKSGRANAVPMGDLTLAAPGVVAEGGLTQIGWIGDHPAAIAGRRIAQPSSAAQAPGPSYNYGEGANLRFDLYSFGRGKAENLTGFAKVPVTTFIGLAQPRGAYVIADGGLWRVSEDIAPSRLTPAEIGTVVAFGTDPHHPQPSPATAYYRSSDAERVALTVFGKASAPVRLVWDLRNSRTLPGSEQSRVYAITRDLTASVSRTTDRWADGFVLNDGAGRTPLALVNAALNERTMAVPTPFTYKAVGQDLSGWLLMPAGAEPGRKLPAVVWLYGGEMQGPQPPANAMTKPVSPLFSGQLMAAQGYAVIYPSTPLPRGESGDLPAALAEEVTAAVDALAAKGLVDPDRIGIIGHSFGGYSTAAVLGVRSDRFKAGVSLAGNYDFQAGWGSKSLGATLSDEGGDDAYILGWKRTEMGQAQLGKPFWKDNAPYIRNSAIQKVETLDAPLLMLHGDLDTGDTGLPGAERMYAALLRAGKKPALIHYWGEGHLTASEWAIRDQWDRITKWFDLYVRGKSGRP